MTRAFKVNAKQYIYAVGFSVFILIILYSSTQWHGFTPIKLNHFNKLSTRDMGVSESTLTSDTRRVFIFFGTRPEIIKLAPLILEVKKSNLFLLTTVFTGQHADIIEKYLRIFQISVDIWFQNTLERKQSINMLFGKIMFQADQIQSSQNDIWIIQGDTTSALAIATVAFHKQVIIAHVEAGLRTFNMYSPYPEEFDRKTISSIATYNFAPTATNVKNLVNEGIDKTRIFVTGNTVIDAAKYVEENQLMKKPVILESKIIDTLVLVTIHRRENFNISDILYKYISMAKCKKCTFLVPVHPNPLAGNSARKICTLDNRFLCVGPLPYEELHWVLKHSKAVLTDSGGIQEEVTWYNTPTIILRKNTERRESIESGIAQIVDTKRLPIIIDEICSRKNILTKEKRFPFGDGHAARKILDILSTITLRLHDNVIMPRKPNDSFLIDAYSKALPLPDLKEETSVKQITNYLKQKEHVSVAVILQVYKRKSLSTQLKSVTSQTLKPATVVIFQNGHFFNVSGIITNYRRRFKDIEFQHIASSKNLRFHGRFHIAFLQEEDYVSVWDDDVYAGKEWLQYCVDYSKAKNFAVVGGNCRRFNVVMPHKVSEANHGGKCDFVGHTWTMPRQFLIFYLALPPLTRYTGEDVQIAFALQKQGIKFVFPPNKGERTIRKIRSFAADHNASWRKDQSPRVLLFCTLLLQKFQFLDCKNCDDQLALRKCVQKNRQNATRTERRTVIKDRKENTYAWS